MSEEKNTKTAIIVAHHDGRERRYDADGWTLTEGTLFVNREGVAVAVYPPTMWTSFRTSDAETPDGNARALGIAKNALKAIARVSDGNVAIKLADDALGEIFAETEL